MLTLESSIGIKSSGLLCRSISCRKVHATSEYGRLESLLCCKLRLRNSGGAPSSATETSALYDRSSRRRLGGVAHTLPAGVGGRRTNLLWLRSSSASTGNEFTRSSSTSLS